LYGSAILWQSHKSIPYKPVFYAEHRRPKTNPIFFRVWGCKGVAGYPPARGHPRGVPLGLVFYALHRRLVAPLWQSHKSIKQPILITQPLCNPIL
jgi:hypothetical protein